MRQHYVLWNIGGRPEDIYANDRREVIKCVTKRLLMLVEDDGFVLQNNRPAMRYSVTDDEGNLILDFCF